MTEKEEILKYLAQEKEVLFREFHLVKLGLFGSFAKGEQTEASDIDLVVEFAPQTEALSEKKEQLRSIVSNRFNRPVDVCREKYIKPYFKEQIINSAIYV